MKLTLGAAALILLLPGAAAQESPEPGWLDEEGFVQSYRDAATDWLYETTDSLDIYFAGSRDEIKGSKKSYVDAMLQSVVEERMRPQYNFKVRASIDLPRTFRRYRLVLESYNDRDDVDEGNTPNPETALTDSQYVLGVQYNSALERYLNFDMGAGVKFRSSGIKPFVSLRIRRSRQPGEDTLFFFENKLYYFFTDDRFDNRFSVTFNYLFNDRSMFEFYNGFRYHDDHSTHELTHAFRFYRKLQPKLMLQYDLSFYSRGSDLEPFGHFYTYAGARIRHLFHQDWLYYEVAPGVMWRTGNDYRPTPRLLVNFGVIFGQRQKL